MKRRNLDLCKFISIPCSLAIILSLSYILRQFSLENESFIFRTLQLFIVLIGFMPVLYVLFRKCPKCQAFLYRDFNRYCTKCGYDISPDDDI